MSGDPYNSADRFMPADYAPKPTVTFEMHREFRSDPMPPSVVAWAGSNLPDGDYVAQYRIQDDAWHFGKVDYLGERRRIVELPEYRYP